MKKSVVHLLFIIGICFNIILSCNKMDTTPSYIKDIDDNKYPIVKIGNQMWMLEDLKVNRYNNGEEIAKHPEGSYNWYSASSTKLCPIGWHVPEHWEWHILNDYTTTPPIGTGYWWSATTLVEGYESPQAWGWYIIEPNTKLNNYVVEKDQYLSIRCIKD